MVSKPHHFLVCVLALAALANMSSQNAFAQNRNRNLARSEATLSIPLDVLLRIVRAEDERRWDNGLRNLLAARNPAVRTRAALAAGRIGDEASVPTLIELLDRDNQLSVRAMAAFALGEIESPLAADALVNALKGSEHPGVRARAIEALGKIAAALPKEQEVKTGELGRTVADVLSLEGNKRSAPDRLTVQMGLTAVLRAKSANAGTVVGKFAHYNDPRIRADAGNTLARLKLKDENVYLRKLLTTDPDPVVRANAARVLGATEDKASFGALLDRALQDDDARVRVSAIRGLASLKDERASNPLVQRGAALMARAGDTANSVTERTLFQSAEANELLEIATAVGRIGNPIVYTWFKTLRPVTGSAPELEIAKARTSPASYLNDFGSGDAGKQKVQEAILTDWRSASAIAQGLGEIAAHDESKRGVKGLRNRAEELLRAMLDYRNSGLTINTLVAVYSEYAIPDALRALAAFKPKDLDDVLRRHLKDSDVVVRATAAELLGELPLNINNIEALGQALPVALNDKELNDAALSIIDALAKQKNRNANQAIKPALDSSDYLVRRRAIAALKATGAGNFSTRTGTVGSRNTAADYERAISRIGRTVRAVVSTTKGSFTIELLPEEAPLNVDNFVQLAKRGYFNGITFHRVVPNFVIQGGDPRGDGNGGPGYQIRCEINQVPYARGAVGMALSGKDTGGSQWFVTHSPQPHLDGGYTVFGNVTAGMDVVDKIVRGDAIRSVTINEPVVDPPPQVSRVTRKSVEKVLRKKFAVLALLPVAIVLVGAATSQGMGTRAPSLANPASGAQIQAPSKTSLRPRYQIELKLDFDARSYTGSERVRWVNRSGQAASVLFFHLYSNLRAYQASAVNANPQSLDAEEPRIQITEVRSAANNTPLTFSNDDHGTVLRVNLRESVPAGQSTEVVIAFKGSVPEVDPDETNLTTHVIKQVSAALRGEREVRRPRDINFRCRGVMLLGTSYPVLAVNDGNEWARKVESTVGDMIFNEVADYEVKITSESGVAVYTSAAADTVQVGFETDKPGATSTSFAGAGLRDFAIVAGRSLRSEQVQVDDTTVRSIFIPEHERMGKRVLTMAADSLRVYRAKFGPLPFRNINIAEAPLVAGLGSTEFSGMDVIASAFYVDFDSPSMRNLPELIREQRTSVEDSLEWSVAHLIAHQWWGAAVGNDPAREPVLDEAMASYSALQYFQEIYGEAKATAVLEDQLRGVYRVYRTLGGDDMNADRPARDYKNTFQYAAIVSSKGALMFVQLQQLLGEQKLLTALRNYYQANLFEIAELDDLRGAVMAESPIEQRRIIARTFNRWLASRKGDEDIAKPDQELATSIGLPTKPPQKSGDRSALNAFARLGKFFWQQMTRIR